MDDNNSKGEFDVAVIGTGLHESMVAGSLARHGLRVLHLDACDIYGGPHKTITGASIRAWTESLMVQEAERKDNCGSDEPDKKNDSGPAAAEEADDPGTTWHAPGAGDRALFSELSLTGSLPERPREYGLDALALLSFCRGPFTDAIVRSGVSHYLEFKAVDATHFASGAEGSVAQRVPCSRADVFKTKALGLVEKRMLMMFLSGEEVAAAAAAAAATAAASKKADDDRNEDDGDKQKDSNGEEENDDPATGAGGNDGESDVNGPPGASPHAEADARLDTEHATFGAFLRNKYKFTDNLVEIVSFAIALCREGPDAAPSVGLAGTRAYLSALGRYGATAFLAPYYGVGEWPQAFCRLAAVEGAVYMLGTAVRAFGCQENGVGGDATSSVTTLRYTLPDGTAGTATVRAVVAGPEQLPRAWLADIERDTISPPPPIARAAVFTRGSLRVAEGNPDEISSVIVPPGRLAPAGSSSVVAVQVGAQCGVCPDGVRAIHITIPAAPGTTSTEAVQALDGAVAALVINEDDKQPAEAEAKATDAASSTIGTGTGESQRSLQEWRLDYVIEPLARAVPLGSEITSDAGIPRNVVRVGRPNLGTAVTVDHVVAEAESAFRAAAKVLGLPADAEFLPPPARTHEEAMLEAELAAEIEEVQKRSKEQGNDAADGEEPGTGGENKGEDAE